MRLIIVVAVALLFTGTATAYAAWARSASLQTGAVIKTGTIGLTATWAAGPPSFTGWPGEIKSVVVHVAHSGQGRWQYSVLPATGGAITDGAVVTYESTSGSPATCTGTALTQPSPALPAGGSADFCVVVKQPPGLRTAKPFTVTVTAKNLSTK